MPLDTEILEKQCRDWIGQMRKIFASDEFKAKMKGKAKVVASIKAKVNTIESQLQKNNYKKLSTKLYEFNQKYADHFK